MGGSFQLGVDLVPKQHSSAGKSSLGSLSKSGNRDLRTLLIHGARAVMRYGINRTDAMGDWLRSIIGRRGRAKAIVAMANKLGRIAWRVLATDSSCDIHKAFKAV
jgi:transposase